MRERPILFNAEMVRAILEGRKTQTRRGVTRLDGFGQITEFGRSDTPGYDWTFRDKRRLWNDISAARLLECCHYGKPGDRLWVRETWRTDVAFDRTSPSNIPRGSRILFEADYSNDCYLGGKSRPSIHMPRWASRINLEITGVRVERLNDCSEADAKAEGVAHPFGGWIGGYQKLWESINGPGSWDANPWVWVIEFKRVMP